MTDRSPAEPPADWSRWVGRTEERTDTVTAAPLAGLAALLDVGGAAASGDPTVQDGARLPPLAHWLYFLPTAPQHEIGPDGHPRRGGFLPPVDLPRRMWAGGRLKFHQPLRLGDRIVRRSTIASVDSKAGRSGRLVFVTVRHEVAVAGGPVALSEEHDIVYRDPPAPGSAPPAAPAAPTDEAYAREVVPDPVLLFRYSALTFNGHRIHYDRAYATEAEGYAGLVVHGPLIATLLVDLVGRKMPGAQIRRFAFRAASPLVDIHPFSVCGRPADDVRSVRLWARNHQGLLAMQAEAELA